MSNKMSRTNELIESLRSMKHSLLEAKRRPYPGFVVNNWAKGNWSFTRGNGEMNLTKVRGEAAADEKTWLEAVDKADAILKKNGWKRTDRGEGNQHVVHWTKGYLELEVYAYFSNRITVQVKDAKGVEGKEIYDALMDWKKTGEQIAKDLGTAFGNWAGLEAVDFDEPDIVKPVMDYKESDKLAKAAVSVFTKKANALQDELQNALVNAAMTSLQPYAKDFEAREIDPEKSLRSSLTSTQHETPIEALAWTIGYLFRELHSSKQFTK